MRPCRPFICDFESRKCLAAAIGAPRAGMRVRVIRRPFGLFRSTNRGRGLDECKSGRRAEGLLALRLMRRRGGGEKTCGDKHFTRRVWTDYPDGLGFIRLRAPNQNTLGATVRPVMQSTSGFFASVRRELGTRDVVLAVASLFLGWLIAHGYYLRALADVQADAEERQRVNELVLRGIESVGTIKYARDASGKVTGVSVQLTGEARSTSQAGGELTTGATSAASPAAPNPSIERTVAGKPAPAAHVER